MGRFGHKMRAVRKRLRSRPGRLTRALVIVAVFRGLSPGRRGRFDQSRHLQAMDRALLSGRRRRFLHDVEPARRDAGQHGWKERRLRVRHPPDLAPGVRCGHAGQWLRVWRGNAGQNQHRRAGIRSRHQRKQRLDPRCHRQREDGEGDARRLPDDDRGHFRRGENALPTCIPCSGSPPPTRPSTRPAAEAEVPSCAKRSKTSSRRCGGK